MCTHLLVSFILMNDLLILRTKKDDLIEGLRKERNEYKKQVEDLKKALQNKQNKI